MLKTICQECNNLLGTYDVKLVDFFNYINSYINSTLTTFGKIKIEGNVNDIKKCVLGHILSGFEVPNKSDEPKKIKKLNLGISLGIF